MIKEDLEKIQTTPPEKVPDFSLVLGGPLFHLYRRTHLSLEALQLVKRRILVIALLAWLPLLFLSALQGHALRGTIRIPFLFDVEAQVRFLVALPLFILSELIVHRRITPLVRLFLERRIVRTEDLPKFREAVYSALRIRNSVTLELALLVFVYTVGLWTWRSQVMPGGATWYAAPDETRLHLTLAGYWYAFVSIPIFQFMLLRWYLRLTVWFRLLWQISRLNLRLTAAHPDRAGGIGFLGRSSYAFLPFLFAQGAMLSGLIANRIIYEGQTLRSFEMEAAGFVSLFMMWILIPIIPFALTLERTRQRGATEYGLLASRYVFGFEDKWIAGGAENTSELLGASDIQSLADLSNSYGVVREMRLMPFSLGDIAWLAAATATPLLPLALTQFSGEELLLRFLKMIFGF